MKPRRIGTPKIHLTAFLLEGDGVPHGVRPHWTAFLVEYDPHLTAFLVEYFLRVFLTKGGFQSRCIRAGGRGFRFRVAGLTRLGSEQR